ncbi:MAG: exodeoxyribonuclease VII small subunit [Oscillospiraceae bacterium]|nr:exodeoxyribonuclease VII small subunit [Oscillospiraceae bacterium]
MEQSKTFETSVKRLEEIVRLMERGDVPLEQALSLFEEGTGLIRSCTKQLDEAELKVVRLMKGPDGEPVELPFTEEA